MVSLFHRGPDGAGEFAADYVHLGMRRLSIIDLEGGWQPLYNEDKTIVLVANGEIYNHIELRRTLSNKGHRFTTASDCEAIVHLYEEYGLDCVEHLRGMFAFAIWDVTHCKLLLARDRMGEKPLYIAEQKTNQGLRVLFSSELKSLMSSGQINFELDPVALNEFMHYGFVPEPRTPILGVRKLPAGTVFTIDLQLRHVTENSYWKLEDAPPLIGDPASIIRAELEQVGELVTRADVPLGVALSGGLDSSVVAALAAKYAKGTVHAFSVGYKGTPRQDERSEARACADHLKLQFHDLEIAIDDVLDGFRHRQLMCDDPIADIASAGYFAVAKLARESNVPVLMQGHGMDELAWGYPWLRDATRLSIEKNRGQDRGIAGAREFLPDGVAGADFRRYVVKMGTWLSGWNNILPERSGRPDQLVSYDLQQNYWSGVYGVRYLYTSKFREALQETTAADLFCFERPWQDIPVLVTKLACDIYLRENGIAQGDRLSMASSVELRLPLVDYRLAETIIGLRKSYQDHELGHKAWFRAAIRGLVPDEVLDRPKRGFTPPVSDWLRALRSRYGSLLEDGFLVQGGYFEPLAVKKMLSSSSRFSAWPGLFYKALVLESWVRDMAEVTRRANNLSTFD